MPATDAALPRRPKTSSVARFATGALVLGLIALGGGAGYVLSERQGMAQLAAVANERLDLYASALEAELARHAYLPGLIAIDADIAALLDEPDDAARRQRASRALARINVRAGSIMMQITSDDGRVLATSDRESEARSDGRALPMTREIGAFFAANPDNATTDYYFVHGVFDRRGKPARIVIKISLAPLEATWVDLGLRTQSERLLVVDENNVIVLCSVPEWKYRTMGESNMPGLRASGRYDSASLKPLKLIDDAPLDAYTRLVRVIEPPEPRPLQRLAQERAILSLAARVVAFSDPSGLKRSARYAGWGGGAGGAALGLLLLYLLQRRRAMRQLFHARNELQSAHDQLEFQVDERTSQLQATNAELKRQVAQRIVAEDELMHAGKMAALGQMSAGISHEINQPLQALRALSRNTIRLLADGRTGTASDNLRSIDEMAERMGRIIGQLKSFARKGGPSIAAVDLARAVRDVLLLLEHRRREHQVQVVVDIPAGMQVHADVSRLEQVLVNLVSNAFDAMAESARRELRIEASRESMPDDEAGRVVVAVVDSGHGASEEVMAHLLEPFFTTKPAGQGLGLGLVISSNIVREFGGTLKALRVEAGMRFEFDLEAAESVGAHHV